MYPAVWLMATIRRLFAAARTGELGLAFSNLGMYAIRFGTPAITIGEPLLLFVRAVEDWPVAVDQHVVIRAIQWHTVSPMTTV